MPGKYNAVIPVIGYRTNLTVTVSEDVVSLRAPDPFDDLDYEVCLFADETDQVIEALQTARDIAAEFGNDDGDIFDDVSFAPRRFGSPDPVPAVEVNPAVPVARPWDVSYEDIINSYILDESTVVLDYEKLNGEWVTRTISPYEVGHSEWSGADFIVAWDHEREDIRSFRLDRIQGTCPGLAEFVPSEDRALA